MDITHNQCWMLEEIEEIVNEILNLTIYLFLLTITVKAKWIIITRLLLFILLLLLLLGKIGKLFILEIATLIKLFLFDFSITNILSL